MKQTTLRILGMGAAMLLHLRAAEAGTAPPVGGGPPPASAQPPASPLPAPPLAPSAPATSAPPAPSESAAVPPLPPTAWDVAPPSPSVGAPAQQPRAMAPPGWGWGPPPRLEEPFPLEAPRPTKGYWYGWQIIIPNAIVEVAGILSLAAQSWVGVAFCSGARALSGPIIHFAHGNPGKAGVSFLLEGVLPAAMIATTVVSVNACRGSSCLAPTLIGVLGIPITVIGGMIVDTALFAVEDSKPASASARGRGGATYALAPLLVVPLQAEKGTANAGRKGWLEEAPIGLSLVGRF